MWCEKYLFRSKIWFITIENVSFQEGVDAEAATLFDRLVDSLRRLSYPDLSGQLSEADLLCRDGRATYVFLRNKFELLKKNLW